MREMALTKGHQKSVQHLLTLILEGGLADTSVDTEVLKENLDKIIAIDVSEEVTNPDVYCYYEKMWLGLSADAIIKLSTYITHRIHGVRYYLTYTDVSVTIDIKDVTIGICEDSKCYAFHRIPFDNPLPEYDRRMLQRKEEQLIAHMERLEPRKGRDFLNSNRYEKLVEYAKELSNRY